MACLEKIDNTTYILSGDLVFSTINQVYEETLTIFKNSKQPLSISLEGVKHIDSSGLALTLEWYRLMKKNKQQLNIINMPKQMADLAKLSSVNELLALA